MQEIPQCQPGPGLTCRPLLNRSSVRNSESMRRTAAPCSKRRGAMKGGPRVAREGPGSQAIQQLPPSCPHSSDIWMGLIARRNHKSRATAPTLALEKVPLALSGHPHLAVGNGVKDFTDLGWSVDFLFREGERVRGNQRISGHHTVHFVGHHQVFLQIFCCLVVNLCPTLGDPTDCGVPGHPILD